MQNKFKLGILGLAAVLLVSACNTLGPGQSVLAACNAAYGTLASLNNLNMRGHLTSEQVAAVNTSLEVIHPICFTQDPIPETADAFDIVTKGVNDLLAVQSTVRDKIKG